MSLGSVKGKKVNVELWAPVNEVESMALDQLKNVASLPWVFHHVAAMPDVHYGKGATVGSVIAMKNAVAPAAVGVDIGCGVASIRTNLKASDLPDNLDEIRGRIAVTIPHGNSYGTGEFDDIPGKYKWSPKLATEVNNLVKEFPDLTTEVQDLKSKMLRQIGTLGGGNHFIELCLDTEQNVWMLLHSGSRNIGKCLAEVHIKKAMKLAHNIEAKLPDKELSVFLAGTPEMEAYRRDLYWAQNYARLNREAMLEAYLRTLKEFFPHVQEEHRISCHHNYVAEETHFGEHVFVTRKGAIRAGKDEWGIIPGSMGTKSYIVRGLGNPDSFESASHGAGRKFSRGHAKRTITMDEFREAMVGVSTNITESVLDEAPQAYKNIEKVMKHQEDLVKIEATLKQVLCVKGE
jgi:tRNA-splicing ligase RtcB